MKKVILPGFLAAILMAVVGYILGLLLDAILPVLKTQYATCVFRPWEDPKMWLFFLSPLILGFVLACMWNLTKSLFKGSPWCDSFWFTLAYFGISTVPGMIITYSSFNVSVLMVFTWTLMSVVQVYCAGVLLAYMNKRAPAA